MEVYQFRRRSMLVLGPWEAAGLAEGSPSTVNLGRDPVDRVERVGDHVHVYVRGRSYSISEDSLSMAASDRYAWYLDNGILKRAAVVGRGFKAIEPIGRGAPTLWINGIHMHRIKGSDPLRDAFLKVKSARVRPGDKVLDICTGLGYTSIASLRRGARLVVTIEYDEDVLFLASLNPWSSELESGNAIVIKGDATIVVDELNGGFDRIIHDPPRFSSSTGDLYSIEFYSKLYNLLKPGGTLFHYTGEAGRTRRVNLPGSVASRLSRAGFIVAGYDRRSLGVVAYRPRGRL